MNSTGASLPEANSGDISFSDKNNRTTDFVGKDKNLFADNAPLHPCPSAHPATRAQAKNFRKISQKQLILQEMKSLPRCDTLENNLKLAEQAIKYSDKVVKFSAHNLERSNQRIKDEKLEKNLKKLENILDQDGSSDVNLNEVTPPWLVSKVLDECKEEEEKQQVGKMIELYQKIVKITMKLRNLDSTSCCLWSQDPTSLLDSYKVGNCGEMAEIAFFALLKCNCWFVNIDMVTFGNHQFLVIGRKIDSDIKDYKTWGDTAVVCDPWNQDFFPATQIPEKLGTVTGGPARDSLSGYLQHKKWKAEMDDFRAKTYNQKVEFEYHYSSFPSLHNWQQKFLGYFREIHFKGTLEKQKQEFIRNNEKFDEEMQKLIQQFNDHKDVERIEDAQNIVHLIEEQHSLNQDNTFLLYYQDMMHELRCHMTFFLDSHS